jgi:hypothetical protein
MGAARLRDRAVPQLLCDRLRVREIKLRKIIQSSRTFWSLGPDERRIAWRAAIGLTATWLGLRVFGFRRWKEFVAGQARRAQRAKNGRKYSATSANRIVQLESAAARNLFFKTNCLEQSLALWPLLCRYGFLAELKIGARKHAEQFEAHAWVELDGRALNNEADEHREFIPFDGPVTAMNGQVE